MNKIILIGNVVADPELKKTASDLSVCTFRIAVQRRFQNKEGVREADFITIVAWKQTAELCAKYLAKGRKCGVVGTLQTRTYDAQDGTKRYVSEVVADEVEFLTPKGDSGNSANSYTPPIDSMPVNQEPTHDLANISDEELPF